MMEDVLVKLNVGLLLLKMHSTKRGLDIRFDKLKKLKLNNWTEETEVVNVRTNQPATRSPKK